MSKVDIEKAELYLSEMGELLEKNNCSPFWANKLKSLAAKKTLCPDDFRVQIKSMFGGMGSLNDLVLLDDDGKVDRDLNIIFDDLRKKLFDVI
ncbi:DUF6966 domain-containing protein [Curvivirga sp.]|uniref:DUF6966 domain-containing protein n=1 Tax=Curvivirga sp. TaxID=2856848 RepID=UPI003B59D074